MLDFVFSHHGAALDMLMLNFKAVLLIAAIYSIFRVFKITATWRHRLWFFLFLILPFLPLMNTLAPHWHIPIFHRPVAQTPETMEPVSPVSPINSATAEQALTNPQSVSHLNMPEQKSVTLTWSHFTPRTIFLLFWITGILFFQIRYVIGQIHLFKLVNMSKLADDARTATLRKHIKSKLDVVRRIEILVCPNLHTPLATGFFRFRILVPEDYLRWSRAHLEYVLLHETAHIKRRDMLSQFIVHVITSVFWFNPAVWFAHRQFVFEREHACDDLVVTYSNDPKSYADMLLQFAQKLSDMPRVAYAGLSMARSSQLEGRLIAILNTRRYKTSRKNVIGTILLAAGMLVSILGFSPFAVGDTQSTIDTTHTALVIESLKYALDDDDGDVRENAVKTLGKINTPRSTELLYSALQKSNDWDVEVNAAKILLQRGETQALDKFINQLSDENADVRKRSAKILCELKHPAAFKPLTKAMNDNNADVKEHIVRALSELRMEEAIKPLSDAATDEDMDIRRIAVWGLGETKSVKALPPLYKALHDLDGKVRNNAIESIGDIKNPDSIEFVLPLLTDREWFVRREVIRVLAELSATNAVPGIINALHDDHKKVREAAAEALGQLGDRRAIVPLSAALHDDCDDVRKEAANALGEFYKEK